MPDLAAPLPLPSAPVGPGAVQTLLLIEDSRHAAEAVRLLSRRLGLRLRRADTLEGARRHLRVYRPDLVLIDLGLPDGSGLDLIAELARAVPRLRRIVAMSADPDGAGAAGAAGADAFVAKPLRIPQDLAALLGPGSPVWIDPGIDGAGAGRNGGADPLALRDDLVRAQAVLADDPGRRLEYAARFVQGLARCTGDEGLGRAAAEARVSGQTGALLAALTARATAAPGL